MPKGSLLVGAALPTEAALVVSAPFFVPAAVETILCLSIFGSIFGDSHVCRVETDQGCNDLVSFFGGRESEAPVPCKVNWPHLSVLGIYACVVREVWEARSVVEVSPAESGRCRHVNSKLDVYVRTCS